MRRNRSSRINVRRNPIAAITAWTFKCFRLNLLLTCLTLCVPVMMLLRYQSQIVTWEQAAALSDSLTVESSSSMNLPTRPQNSTYFLNLLKQQDAQLHNQSDTPATADHKPTFLPFLQQTHLLNNDNEDGSAATLPFRKRVRSLLQADDQYVQKYFLLDKGRASNSKEDSILPVGGLTQMDRLLKVLPPAAQVAPRPTQRVTPLVIGISTVKRPKTSYLLHTLASLFSAMSSLEKSLTTVLLQIAEIDDLNFAGSLATDLNSTFSSEISSGLLELVVPPKSFYPDLNLLMNMKNRFNDSGQRFKWRSKQALDFAFLMANSAPRGSFYLQLEDDLDVKEGFVSIIFCDIFENRNNEWVQLQYSKEGFIGKLFHTSHLPQLADLILAFYQDEPVDWILFDYVRLKACHPGLKEKDCIREVAKVDKIYKTPLFTHLGKYSSLENKVFKKVKEKPIRQFLLDRPHNPPAMSHTNLIHHKEYSFQRLYEGLGEFWGISPKPGDFIIIDFSQPVVISNYSISSGGPEQPKDLVLNASLEMKSSDAKSLPVMNMTSSTTEHNVPSRGTRTKDGYIVIDLFNQEGECQGSAPRDMTSISSLRIRFHSTLQNWVFMTKIDLKR